MFQAWPPKREHNKFECKECRPPREIDISREIHDLLSHKPKSSAWICHCGHAELIRECFKTHLRKKHRVEVASTQSCDSAYYCYGIPTFRSMWHCKTCDFRTCYGELKDFHKCEEHKGYHVQPRFERSKSGLSTREYLTSTRRTTSVVKSSSGSRREGNLSQKVSTSKRTTHSSYGQRRS